MSSILLRCAFLGYLLMLHPCDVGAAACRGTPKSCPAIFANYCCDSDCAESAGNTRHEDCISICESDGCNCMVETELGNESPCDFIGMRYSCSRGFFGLGEQCSDYNSETSCEDAGCSWDLSDPVPAPTFPPVVDVPTDPPTERPVASSVPGPSPSDPPAVDVTADPPTERPVANSTASTPAASLTTPAPQEQGSGQMACCSSMAFGTAAYYAAVLFIYL